MICSRKIISFKLNSDYDDVIPTFFTNNCLFRVKLIKIVLSIFLTRTCKSAHMHTFTHTQMHTGTLSHMQTCTQAHMYTGTQAHMYTGTHAYRQKCTQAHMRTCTYANRLKFTQTHARTKKLYLHQKFIIFIYIILVTLESKI